MHDRLSYLVKMEDQGPYLFPAPNNQKSYKIYEIIVQDTGHLATKNSGSTEKETNKQCTFKITQAYNLEKDVQVLKTGRVLSMQKSMKFLC